MFFVEFSSHKRSLLKNSEDKLIKSLKRRLTGSLTAKNIKKK